MTGRQGRTEIRHEGVQRRVGQSRRRGFGGMGMRGRFAGMGSQRQVDGGVLGGRCFGSSDRVRAECSVQCTVGRTAGTEMKSCGKKDTGCKGGDEGKEAVRGRAPGGGY